MAQPAWDEWFDSQSTLCTQIEELVNEACRGKSPGYRLAVHAAIIESVSERMRVDIDCPTPMPESRTPMLTADFSRGLPDLRAGVYRHYKGPLYQVLGYAHDANADSMFEQVGERDFRRCDTTESGDDRQRVVVVYFGLELTDAHKGPRLAVRTAEDFFALVCDAQGHDWDRCLCPPGVGPVPRFECLGSAWYGQR